MIDDLLQDLSCLLKNHIDSRELFSRVLIHQKPPVDLDHQGRNPLILIVEGQWNDGAGEWRIDFDVFKSLPEKSNRP